MKIKILILLSLLTVLSCNSKSKKAEEKNRGYIVNIGDIAPDFTATLNNGKTFTLSQQKGKVVMLQFTASWCGVCRKEMPFIEQEIHLPNIDKDFVILGIDKDEPLETVMKFAQKTGITYPLALDPNSTIFEKYAHPKAGVTRNVIINREGKIIYLTRLFNREEFDAMKLVIEKELQK